MCLVSFSFSSFQQNLLNYSFACDTCAGDEKEQEDDEKENLLTINSNFSSPSTVLSSLLCVLIKTVDTARRKTPCKCNYSLFSIYTFRCADLSIWYRRVNRGVGKSAEDQSLRTKTTTRTTQETYWLNAEIKSELMRQL